MDNIEQLDNARKRTSYIHMVMTPYGKFIGKKVDEQNLREAAEVFHIEVQQQVQDPLTKQVGIQKGIQIILHNLGNVYVSVITPIVWVEIDNKSPLYVEYFKATAGLSLK